MTSQDAEPVFDDWQAFFDEFQEESPRAAAIVAATFLDGLLRQLVSGALISNKTAQTSLLGEEDGGDAPLATFSARIRAAYALGLISAGERHDLDLVRRIRNKFAHARHGCSFDDPKITEWCSKFRLAEPIILAKSPHFDGQRERFQISVSFIAMYLTSRIVQARDERPVSPGEYRFHSVGQLGRP